ncbi:hypothetical protein J4453_02580 [Candidatus Woesearchaeota archaeon]|nr:hypothetical protein [Candidatus Woesearchaeota archaeon]
MLPKKAQSAMEFLMTYGWAILIVLVAVGALAYMGVMKADRFAPEACTLAPGLYCADFRVTSSDVTLLVENTLNEDVIVTRLSFPDVSCEEDVLTVIPKESRETLQIACNLAGLSVFRSKIHISYQNGIFRTKVGSLTALVSDATSSFSQQTICREAQDNRLCDGLDILYGEGYGETCCAEFGLCCG